MLCESFAANQLVFGRLWSSIEWQVRTKNNQCMQHKINDAQVLDSFSSNCYKWKLRWDEIMHHEMISIDKKNVFASWIMNIDKTAYFLHLACCTNCFLKFLNFTRIFGSFQLTHDLRKWKWRNWVFTNAITITITSAS